MDVSFLQIVQEILDRRIPDRPVFVFGSRARGRARRRSDLDLAIGGQEPLGRELIATLKDDFSESDLPIFVDLLEISSIDTNFSNASRATSYPYLLVASSHHEL